MFALINKAKIQLTKPKGKYKAEEFLSPLVPVQSQLQTTNEAPLKIVEMVDPGCFNSGLFTLKVFSFIADTKN